MAYLDYFCDFCLDCDQVFHVRRSVRGGAPPLHVCHVSAVCCPAPTCAVPRDRDPAGGVAGAVPGGGALCGPLGTQPGAGTWGLQLDPPLRDILFVMLCYDPFQSNTHFNCYSLLMTFNY